MLAPALPNPRATLALLAAAAGLALACGSARAEGGQGLLAVRAVVARHASVSVAPPVSIAVSAEDVARGYLELPVPVTVRGNMSEGYSLLFERRAGEFGDVRILGLDQPLVVGAAGAVSTRPAPGHGMWRDQLSLRFRLALAPGATPGERAWPVRISLLPL